MHAAMVTYLTALATSPHPAQGKFDAAAQNKTQLPSAEGTISLPPGPIPAAVLKAAAAGAAAPAVQAAATAAAEAAEAVKQQQQKQAAAVAPAAATGAQLPVLALAAQARSPIVTTAVERGQPAAPGPAATEV